MGKSILYVIGNGFDLYHGLPTRYSDFQHYLEVEYPDLKSDLDRYFAMDVDEQYLWRRFEADLATYNWERF